MARDHRGTAGRALTLALHAAFLCAVGWVALGLVQETLARHHRYGEASQRAVPASAWQLGSPQARRLEHFLTVTTASIPAGSVIAFTAPRGQQGKGDQDFFAHMWAAYFLPRHHILLGRGPGAAREATYRIDFRPPNATPSPPGWQPLVRHPLGNAYRRQPAPPGP